MPCSRCSNLPFHDPSWLDPIPHQASYADLSKSAIEGCQVCTLSKAALLDTCAFVRGCSVDEAEQYQHHLDQLATSDDQDTRLGNTSSEDNDTLDISRYSLFVRRVSRRPSQRQSVVGVGYRREFKEPEAEVDCLIDVSSDPGSIALHEWNVVGRRVMPMADVALAKTWIQDCSKGHEQCQLDSSLHLKMPLRLLDLQPLPDGNVLDLRLVVKVETYGPYVALSHCWSKSQPLKLLQASYEDFQRVVSYETLPRTFQDAVTATRALEVRYLWIDSLCIIQDSKTDWEEQCAEMGRIYKFSSVTIAGPAAANCAAGFLHPRPPPSLEVSLIVKHGRSLGKIVLGYRGVDMHLIELTKEPNAPLSRRAWTFQERMLAQRILYFGTRAMYLGCFTHVWIDTCHHPIESTDFNGATIAKKRIEDLDSRSQYSNYWVSMVHSYSALTLTKRSDKLPALAGLSSEFSRISAISPYLAGIWRDELPRGLTWYVYDSFPTVSVTFSTEYIAPSWSWAAVDRGVRYLMDSDLEFLPDFSVTDAEATPSGSNPHGTVSGGHINGTGKIQSFLIQRKPHADAGSFKVFPVSGSQAPLAHVQYIPDNGSAHIHVEAGTTETCDKILLLHLGSYRGKTSGSFAVALGLERVTGTESTYRRIGLAFWTTSWAYYLRRNNWVKDLPKFADCFREVEKRQIKII